ncbi:MAG: zinc dependent phospholipase C family protein [Clostridia bacterium]
MPNALTHYYISERIFDRLDDNTKRIVANYKKEYALGALGPDIIMGLMLDKEPLKRDAGEKLHNEFVYAGLFAAAEYLYRNNDDYAMYAYFLGFLTHYAADTTVHPYVYYYTENLKNKYDPKLINCLHTIVETEMDVYVANHLMQGKKANSFHRFKGGRKRRKLVSKFFLEINKDIFGLILTEKDIKRSMFFFKLMMLICQRQKNGRLRFFFVKQVDRYIKAEHLLLSALRPLALDNRYDYLNMQKKPYKAIYHEENCDMVNHTFPEMLELAAERGVELIAVASKHIFNGEPMSLEQFKLNYNGGFNDEYLNAGLGVPNGACDMPQGQVNGS